MHTLSHRVMHGLQHPPVGSSTQIGTYMQCLLSVDVQDGPSGAQGTGN